MSAVWRDKGLQSVTITNGQTTTNEEILGEHFVLYGVELPATFSGTSLSFLVASVKGGTYQALYDDAGALVTLTVAQGKSYVLPAALAVFPCFKIVSNATETGARAFNVVKKG